MQGIYVLLEANFTRIVVFLLLGVFINTVLDGCALKQGRQEISPEEAIPIIKKYWQERLFGSDAGFLYRMEDPENRPDFEEYKNWVFTIQRFKIEKFEITSLSFDEKEKILTVKVKIYFFHPQIRTRKPFLQIITDKWILRAKGWKHLRSG